MHVSTIIAHKGNGVYTIEPGKMIADTITILSEKKIGAIVVVELGGAVAGIISERDIVDAIAADGPAALSRPVKDYMSKEVICVTLDDTIESLMSQMTEKRVRHLPVMENGRLNGIVSIGDVVKHRIAEAEAEADALKSYIASG